MNFIIEYDGPIIDVRPTHYRAFCAVVAELGWSCLDEPTYWRLVRTKGRQANLLPGAKPAKHEQFHQRFAEVVEAPDNLAIDKPHGDRKMNLTLHAIARYGPCIAVTLGTNVETRRTSLQRLRLIPPIKQAERLNADPRRRPAELLALSHGDKHTIVAASSEPIIRAAREAELFALGIAAGPCTPARLNQAGADVVYDGLDDLVASLRNGVPDLVAAGLPPMAVG